MSHSSKKDLTPLFWPCRFSKGVLEVLDETLIPQRVTYIKVRSTADAVKVIRDMKTRAFGQFLVVLETFLLVLTKFNVGTGRDRSLLRELERTAEALNKSRPTFPFAEVTGGVIYWAKEAMEKKEPMVPYLKKRIEGYLAGIRGRRLGRVEAIAAIIKDGDSLLTHCNVSGELAMAAVLCQQQKKKVRFYATETRPYFQGSRLTCWELKKVGADVTLIADNAVGSVMADELVNKVIVGSDRNCANGDFANKIGTYQIAVLAKEFGIPFYVLTQPSNKIKSGAEIPIELRPEDELLKFEGKRTMPAKAAGLYPGFDVIPNEYVTEAIAINVN